MVATNILDEEIFIRQKYLLAQKNTHNGNNFRINLSYAEIVYTITIRCMTTHLNLNLKFKFYSCVMHPTLIVYTPSVYVKFTFLGLVLVVVVVNCIKQELASNEF